MKFLNWYTKKLVENPYKTKCTTSFIIYGLGDLLCQKLETLYDKEKIFDSKRTIIQASYGIFEAPYSHFQFNILIPKLFPMGSSFYLPKTVIFDQLVNGVAFNCGFFTYNDILGGKSLSQSIEETKIKLYPTLLDNWKVWPFISVINFTITPAPYRVLVVNLTGLFWNTYLSYVQNIKGKVMIEAHNNKISNSNKI